MNKTPNTVTEVCMLLLFLGLIFSLFSAYMRDRRPKPPERSAWGRATANPTSRSTWNGIMWISLVVLCGCAFVLFFQWFTRAIENFHF